MLEVGILDQISTKIFKNFKKNCQISGKKYNFISQVRPKNVGMLDLQQNDLVKNFRSNFFMKIWFFQNYVKVSLIAYILSEMPTSSTVPQFFFLRGNSGTDPIQLYLQINGKMLYFM